MTLDGIIFLASYSSRARAYAQAMNEAGLLPSHTVTFGDPARDAAPSSGAPSRTIRSTAEPLFLPDPSIPLLETLDAFPGTRSQVDAGNVNDDEVVAHLKELGAKAVVYAGYGGQIVGEKALAAAPFVHMHCGWLPDYRGSTTAYYSWLDGEGCGVTALLLDAGIDTGGILLRRAYPPPPAGVDIDHVYDSALRSDCLIGVLRHIAETGALPPAEPQPEDGRTYYVMHPVLRHVAQLHAPRGDWRQDT